MLDPLDIKPKARAKRLLIRELENETLVYDLNNDEATCLNQAAVDIWRLCDGSSAIREIVTTYHASQLSKSSTAEGLDPDWSSDVVIATLVELNDANLLFGYETRRGNGQDRRQLIRGIAASALTAPMVLSISVPTAAQIASCSGNGADCTSDSECCPTLSCQRQGNSNNYKCKKI